MFLVLSSLLILLLALLGDDLVVLDGLLESLVEEATVVDERHGHEAAEARHALEVHAWLAHHLGHVLVGETLDDVLLSGTARIGSTIFTFLLSGFFLTLLEHFVRDDGLLLGEHHIYHELVALRRVHVLDDLGCLLIEVGLVVGLLIDLLRRVDQLSDVDARGTRLLLDEVHQLLQVVLQVCALLQLLNEVLLGATHGGRGGGVH